MKKLILSCGVMFFSNFTLANDADTFKGIVNYCNEFHVDASMGSCIENNLNARIPAWRNDDHAAYVSAYIEWANAAGSKVEKGELSKYQAHSGSIELLSRLASQAKLAINSSQSDFSTNMALFFAGLAIMATPQEQPSSNFTTYTFPNQLPISCMSLGNMVSCR